MSYIDPLEFVPLTGTKQHLEQLAGQVAPKHSDHALARHLKPSPTSHRAVHTTHTEHAALAIHHDGELTVYTYLADIQAILPLSDLTSNERESLLLLCRTFNDRSLYVVGQQTRKHGAITLALDDLAPLPVAGIIVVK